MCLYWQDVVCSAMLSLSILQFALYKLNQPGGESIIKKSSSPQQVSFRNCLISPAYPRDSEMMLAVQINSLNVPFFLTPRQMTASSRLGSIKAMDITPRLSCSTTSVKAAGRLPELLYIIKFAYLNVYRLPAHVTLVNLLPVQAQHVRDAWTTNIHIKQSNLLIHT